MNRLGILTQRHRDSRGFTLIEILLAMLFLSLGVMGVIAFFFLGVNDNRKSVRVTRGTLIAKAVREALVNAIRYPEWPAGAQTPWYRFELPCVGEDNADALAETMQNLNGFYFHIDDSPVRLGGKAALGLREFNNNGIDIKSRVLDLPYEAFNRNGNQTNQDTWYLRDTFLPERPDSGFDEDDSHYYSFRILIRRAVPRPGEPNSSGFVTPGDLFDCTIYVFRQFPGTNKPILENYDQITGEALFVDGGGKVVEEAEPIVIYHFLLGGS